MIIPSYPNVIGALVINPVLSSAYLARTSSFISIEPLGLLLLGIYYGFLTTLPMGPSQLLCVRALLMEGEGKEAHSPGTVIKSGIVVAAVAGLVIPQFLLFVSIYWSPLSVLFIKPHLWTAMVLPYMFYYLYRSKYFNTESLVKSNNKFYDSKVWSTFLDTFFFQTLNPILLPSPVLARLMSVLLFRYSQIPAFILGGLIGWIVGQAVFMLSSWFLLFRLEKDLPKTYRFAKRLVHKAFSPIVFVLCFSYLGRAPLPFFSKQNLSYGRSELITLGETWPDLSFDCDKWNRPYRFLSTEIPASADVQEKQTFSAEKTVIPESKYIVISELKQETLVNGHQKVLEQEQKNIVQTSSAAYSASAGSSILWNKKRFSQYIMEACVSDGKLRLTYTYPQGLLALQTKLKVSLKIPEFSEKEARLPHEWAIVKASRHKQLLEVLENKIEQLDEATSLDLVIENKIISSSFFETPQAVRLDNESETNTSILKKWMLQKSIEMNNLSILGLWQKPNASDSLALIKPMPFFQPIDLEKMYRDRQKIQIFKRFTYKNGSRNWVWFHNMLRGSVYARVRNKTLFHIVQREPFMPFIARSWELEKKKNLLNKNESIDPKRKMRDFYRWSRVIPYQLTRSPSLILQMYLRKYVKLPVLIVFQNSIRWLVFGKPEWEQDWLAFKQEKYIRLNYDLSVIEDPDIKVPLSLVNFLPQTYENVIKSFLNLCRGLQVQIDSPFEVKPWRTSATIEDVPSDQLDCFLGTFGDLREGYPFGNRKKQPIFFQPFKRVIQQMIERKVRRQFAKVVRLIHPFTEFLPMPGLSHKLFRIKASVLDSKESDGMKIDSIPSKLSSQTSKSKIEPLSRSQIKEQPVSLEPSRSIDLCQTMSQFQENVSKQRQYRKQKKIAIQTYFSVQASSDNKILTQYSWLGRPPMQMILYGHFRIRLISDESQRAIGYKYVQIKNQFLKLDRSWVYSKMQVRRFVMEMRGLFFILIHKITGSFLSRWARQFLHTLKCQLVRISRNLRHVVNRLYPNGLKHDIVPPGIATSSLSTINNEVSGYTESSSYTGLSQAYILHKIWQTGIENRFHLTPLMHSWVPGEYLQEYLNTELIAKGILESKESNEPIPQVIMLRNNVLTQDSWQEWIRDLPRYTPSSKIWLDILPRVWSTLVQQYWRTDPDLEKTDLKGKPVNLRFNDRSDCANLENTLNKYNKPLLEKAVKLSKRWHFDLLYERYAGIFKNKLLYQDFHQSSIPSQALMKQEVYIYDHQYLKLFDTLTDADEEGILENQTEWGLARTRQGRLAPYLPFFLETEMEDKTEDKTQDIVEDIVEDIVDDIIDDKAEDKAEDKIENKTEDKIEDKMEGEVGAEVDVEMEIEPKVENQAEVGVQSKTKRKATKRKVKPDPFCWKRMDDKAFILNVLSPFFRAEDSQEYSEDSQEYAEDSKEDNMFINKNTYHPLENQPFWNAFVPESLLLPNKARELRVLEKLYFQTSTNPSIKTNIAPDSAFANDHSIEGNLRRLLWPSHQLEDLACMNRFLMGPGNQSRFSSLRIRMYPVMRP